MRFQSPAFPLENNEDMHVNIPANNIAPEDYAEPLQELVYAAEKTQGFTENAFHMREALANVRGLRKRVLEATSTITLMRNMAGTDRVKEAMEFAREPLELLHELAHDLAAIEQKIADGLIGGEGTA